jgi:hypothetical protein
MFVRSFNWMVFITFLWPLSVEESLDHVGHQNGRLGNVLWT